VIDGFRWSLLGGQVSLYVPGLLGSATVAAAMLVVGIAYFRKVEHDFADLI
jgi:homopolymeric O-antigen transport system permease protein